VEAVQLVKTTQSWETRLL